MMFRFSFYTDDNKTEFYKFISYYYYYISLMSGDGARKAMNWKVRVYIYSV